MNRYTYYTPIDLARKLLKIIPEKKIETMIDICCGSWNLLTAGKEKYPNAKISGIDIDNMSEIYRFEGAFFQVNDGREFALKQYKSKETYDLILSNPPFGFISENDRKFFNEYLDVFYSRLLNKRYECEMIQANLLLAHNNSILLFILPYTFVAGISFKEARRQISNDYSVISIVKLPFTTFGKNKISTFAVVLKKSKQCNKARLYEAEFDKKWELKETGSLGKSEIIKGNWWFRDNCIEKKDTKILRGKISSNRFKEYGQKILHCAAKKTGNWEPTIRYCDVTDNTESAIRAKKGDIVINRIGKDAGYWCVNEYNDILISDCLLVLKNVNSELLCALKSNSDDYGKLNIPVRGLATTYITARDVEILLNK